MRARLALCAPWDRDPNASSSWRERAEHVRAMRVDEDGRPEPDGLRALSDGCLRCSAATS